MQKMKPWSQTYSGLKLYYDDRLETDSQYTLEDIAHHLSQINRYGGACLFPYSVAQHSVLMATWVYTQTQDATLALDALMHDASEYAVGDLRKMLKNECPDFELIENRFDKSIRAQFHSYGVPLEQTDFVKSIDSRIVKDERAQCLMYTEDEWGSDKLEALGLTIEPIDWLTAKREFIYTFNQLVNLGKSPRLPTIAA